MVHLSGDEVEVVGVVCAEVGTFGEVLAEQAVGVLVRASLPRARRVTEVDLEPSRDLDLEMIFSSHCLGPRSRTSR